LTGAPELAVLFGECARSSIELKPDLYIGIPRAASYAFQKLDLLNSEDGDRQVTLSSTAIVKYVGIEKRDGLVNVGRRLLEGGRISSSCIPTLINAIRYSARQPEHSLAQNVSS
jgi:hypothetical protein